MRRKFGKVLGSWHCWRKDSRLALAQWSSTSPRLTTAIFEAIVIARRQQFNSVVPARDCADGAQTNVSGWVTQSTQDAFRPWKCSVGLRVGCNKTRNRRHREPPYDSTGVTQAQLQQAILDKRGTDLYCAHQFLQYNDVAFQTLSLRYVFGSCPMDKTKLLFQCVQLAASCTLFLNERLENCKSTKCRGVP
jgi:hypothetical protein